MTARTYGWVRADESHGHSVARIERHTSGWSAHGTEVLIGPDALSCCFTVVLDADWHTEEVEVSVVDLAGERRTRLRASEGRWEVDGRERVDLRGCVDVDIAATPLTNTFPIRRLASLAVGATRTSPVAWVDVPSLSVHRVDQTYRRLGPGADGTQRWEYADPTHGSFMLTVDEDGVVVDYEDFALRVR